MGKMVSLGEPIPTISTYKGGDIPQPTNPPARRRREDVRTDSTPSGRESSAAYGLLITNLIKLGGLGVVINEAILRTEARSLSLGIAAFMMAGAQGVETLIDRLFGK